ncbi:MAG TPA: winged helix-turn-helix domain-containing protein [Nitrososphaera sp.]|nr:winged helix-turn-helix domain-containing protein [Nitrososphaera sp.]
MAELILETYDKFSVMYDIILELSEKNMSETELARTLGLSASIIEKMMTVMFEEGFLKSGRSDNEFRLTSQGFDFLQEFAGIRKFVG